ncbi:AraC family transcriptional regulator [uncultured Tateyamaria sp.]|uniref:helix-turn-helix domain-containing protein n=1 Tax=uncultured Tateyamaria sp. TaxID=455651 RepID=UPI002616705B|nr:AraC family transcriptional regulator [uncultured Tateyamaria sp.]
MTDTRLITRPAMVRAMSNEFNADLAESFQHSWKRTNTIVVDQGDCAIHGASIDFHLLEFCLTGSHDLSGHSEMEHGENTNVKLLPGSVGYNQPNTSVSQTVVGFAKYQQIYIDDAVVRETSESVLRGDPDSTRPLGFQGVFDPQFKMLAAKLLEEARCPAVGSDLRADLIAQEIALLLLRRRDRARIKLPKVHTLSEGQLAQILSYLEEQIEDIGGMDTLAGLVNMDVFSFTKAFKATTGESPGQFLIQRRLSRVKELLRTTNDTLADITYATGFSNQPHMTSTFTKHVGVSPGKWRKAVRS